MADTVDKVGLLVKASGMPSGQVALQAGLGLGASASATVTPLMPNVHTAQSRALGLSATAAPQWYHVALDGIEASPWDAAHAMTRSGLGITRQVDFVEPDLRQIWPAEPDGIAEVDGLGAAPAGVRAQDANFPREADNDWFRDDDHGAFRAALAKLPAQQSPVRVAHLDTGYDPDHRALPAKLNLNLAKNFLGDTATNDARDDVHGALTNRGHGMGTIGILAGRDPADQTKTIGAAPFVEVVPIRVADRVVLFSNGSIARALDYVLSLSRDAKTRVDIVTMSMGGLASRAWAEAVNALYDAGVFVVTAAGNNIANAPTRNIVFPARFNRVVAACGVMADGKPYANLALKLMAGNYGPTAKMRTAIAASTPNLPWARLGNPAIVDHDGAGTSAATPQVAATAAIWLARHGAELAYPEPWMKVEAIRTALFQGARAADQTFFGRGLLNAAKTIDIAPPKPSALKREAPDKADFAFLRVLLGVGLAGSGTRGDMLELEALQLSQTEEVASVLPDPTVDRASLSATDQAKLAEALRTHPKASRALREALGEVAAPPPTGDQETAPAAGTAPSAPDMNRARKEERAEHPPIPKPLRRRLRIFASDPSLGTELDTHNRTITTIDMPWEELAPGPVGEYLEVIDIDPASRLAYAPVDLDEKYLLHEHGLTPSETDPRFHQQMVYAVASRTIEHFERALGRRALWSPHKYDYVQRLRIYPHAIRAANAYYSPDKKALLLGYFTMAAPGDGPDVTRPTTFAALSQDIIAHETSHALLDGLHRRFIEATNLDCLAFHEAFADIVAMFQHFTVPDAVRPEIAATRGDLFARNRLGELAFQFGQSMGQRGALRDYIGTYDKDGTWQRRAPSVNDYTDATEAHARGAVLVAAIFDAFLHVYENNARDIFRLATGGSGVTPPGELAPSLIDALTVEACQLAGHFLDIAIRALDYCPPFDLHFGEYLRAVITADRDLVPDDRKGYRVALAAAFRARGIQARDVRSVSPDTLAWEKPDFAHSFDHIIGSMKLDWRDDISREDIFKLSNSNGLIFHNWLVSDKLPDELIAIFGIRRSAGPMGMKIPDSDLPVSGTLRGPEVHSVRMLRRVGPSGNIRADLIIEITQRWIPTDPADGGPFRGGCTLIINRGTGKLDYVVRKRIDDGRRFARQTAFSSGSTLGLSATYFNDDGQSRGEPFAALHSTLFE